MVYIEGEGILGNVVFSVDTYGYIFQLIAPVSRPKQTLFIRDVLLIGCFITLSGDSTLLVGYGKPTLL